MRRLSLPLLRAPSNPELKSRLTMTGVFLTGMETGFFRGKVALVTGSSRGIGRAIALAFGRAGSDVVVNHSRSGAGSLNKAEEVCREIEGLGQKAFSVQADTCKSF